MKVGVRFPLSIDARPPRIAQDSDERVSAHRHKGALSRATRSAKFRGCRAGRGGVASVKGSASIAAVVAKMWLEEGNAA